MTEQLSILPKADPDEMCDAARAQFVPVRTACLFSGGHDSTVLAYRCRDHYDELMHIDTGTAVPGVREYVEEFAAWVGKPLVVYEAGDAYERLVMELGGFPGPAGHGRAYTRLKERQIAAYVRDCKVGAHRNACVMLLSGKRKAESARRSKTTLGIDKRKGQLYVNPLIDWTATDMLGYRQAHKLPESPVAALLHRSGECNCGAFAEPGEREMLRSLYPTWFERTIASLERRAECAGIKACKWGERPPGEVAGDDAGPLCSTCEWRQMAIELVPANEAEVRDVA